MDKEFIIEIYKKSIDWTCSYTKGVIAPVLREINFVYPNLTWTQILTLKLLSRTGKINMTQAANAIVVPKPNLTKTIDALVENELVERTADAANRKTVLISLTSKGEEVAADCDCLQKNYFRQLITRNLTESEQKSLLTILEDLNRISTFFN
ncbi:MAG: MarR family transcriptional regulator [Clostridia bacterium]